MFDRRKTLKQKLQKREKVFAAWTSIPDPQITEIFANLHVDFVGIDIEHGVQGYQHCQRIIAAAQAGGSLCLPRVASHNPEMIKRLLDSGADGMILPMVESPKQVEQIIQWVKYPPLGKRSFGVNRAHNYGFDFAEYTAGWNECSSLILQIESQEGIDQLDAMLRYEEVDGVMFGPYDYSGSVGLPGQIEHEKVQAACQKVIELAAKHGKACGNQIVDLSTEMIQAKFKEGYTFLVLSSDIFLMWKWAEQTRQMMNAAR